MSFADPQSIDIGAGAVSLPRTSVGSNQSIYTAADGVMTLTASSTYGRRTRRVLRLDVNKKATDGYTGYPADFSASCYVVFDHQANPLNGFSSAELLGVWNGLSVAANASSDLLITKLLGGES